MNPLEKFFCFDFKLELKSGCGIKIDATKISACLIILIIEADAISFWVFSYRSDHSGQSFRLGCGCCSSVRPIPFGPRLSVFRLRLRLSSSARPTGRTLHLQLCPLPPSRYSAFPQAACRYRAPICDPGGNIFSFTLPKCRSVDAPGLSDLEADTLPPADMCRLLPQNYLHSQSSLLDSCSHFTIRPALRQMCEVLFLMKRSSSHSSSGSSNNCALA